MDASPKGREIRTVEGEPGDIETRGRKIAALGETMGSCADTLQMIASHDLANGEMDGKAVEKLQEKIGDSYETLREASDLYGPVGPIIEAYGKALGGVKDPLNGQVQICEDLWVKYDNMEGAPTHLVPGTGPEEGSPEAKAEEEAAEAKDQAREAWEEAARTWDSYYDTWEDAYDEAVNGIGNEMAGKIEDGFWEVLDDIIAVLEIVALVVGIVALFIAGPFAAIALAISLTVFALRSLQLVCSKCTLWEWASSAIDIIPFGKFGKIAEAGADAAGPLSKFGSKFGAAYGSDLVQIKDIGKIPDLARATSATDVIMRLHTGQSLDEFTQVFSGTENMGRLSIEAMGLVSKQVNWGVSTVNTAVDLPGTAADLAGAE